VKLSDFGLARCLVPTAKERVQLGMGDVPKSTSKDLSGTPFFMAPELWDGETPSVRTDIFSLGVTFYHGLTREHPYFENTAKRALPRNKLRLDPLLASVSAKGNHGVQIVRFIEKCLALDPRRRYQTYQEMFSEMAWIKISQGVHDSLERSEIVAAAAQFFCTKGDIQKAFGLLEKGLNERPTDVVLLEAFGKLHFAVGQVKEAERHFGIAYNSLKPSRGIYKGRFLPRPALAWARSRIRSGDFQEAAEVVEEVLAWGRTHSDRSQAIELVGLGQYSEIGWYLLYRGEFSKAVYELTTYASRYSLDKLESIWAVEAAWLSGTIKAQADEIAIKVLDNTSDVLQSPGEVEFVKAQWVLREYVNPLLKGKLWKNFRVYLLDEMIANRIIANRTSGGNPEDLSINQKPFIAAMDTYSTGEIHHGLIRSLCVPSQAGCQTNRGVAHPTTAP
jgi:tetratricopeptide (TPR) repeat protein